jgi:NAD(P)-dependent dehydrogenase (short-subunit alcohol dehydrogenase family)
MHWMGYISLRDLNWTSRPYSAWVAYGQSKLANLLFTSELQRRLEAAGSPLRAVAAHPGYSHTNLQGQTGRKLGDALLSFGNRLATDADFGARQTLYAVAQDVPGNSFIGPSFGVGGRSRPVGRSPLAKRTATAGALWELSERLTDTKFPL